MKKNRSGMAKVSLIVAALLLATLAIGTIYYKQLNPNVILADEVLTYETFQGEFVSSVNESGDIESSSNLEIRCEVKSLGKSGTAILELVEEGKEVEEGEFLCQLDDSLLQEQLVQQKIQVAQDKASVIQAKSNLNTAERVLYEYENGTYEQELAALKAEVAFAEEAQRRSRQIKTHSENLNRKGYITKTQLEADTFAMEKAELDLTLAQQKLAVYEKFTQERMISQFKAEIEKEEANLEAAQYTLELSEKRESDTAKQIANCRVTAPQAGTVIYANETDRRGDTSFVIEEGALLRDGQPIFFLPDPTQMQVRATVSDSKINLVTEGMKALIRVDTDPERPVAGRVRKVSAFPLPRRWYQAPIEYEVFVDIVEINDLIRPGLRGKVEMFAERLDGVIQCPVSALIRRDEQYFVLVLKDNDLDVRPIEIGSNNESFVVVTEGLQPGELVLIDPDAYQDSVEFPES